MDTIARVRRVFHVQGWSVKKIARELNVSRNTVRKIVRSDVTEFTYKREHQPLPRIGAWRGDVERFLLANEGKAARERLTLIRIYEEARALGYDGSYDTVRRYAKSWAKTRGTVTSEAYIPLYHAPGEAYQFDWSREIVLINDVTTTVKVAHVRLCHSRMMFARAYGTKPIDAGFIASGPMNAGFDTVTATLANGAAFNMAQGQKVVFNSTTSNFGGGTFYGNNIGSTYMSYNGSVLFAAVAGTPVLQMSSSGLVVDGTVKASGVISTQANHINIGSTQTPATSSTSCTTGDHAWDANYVYCLCRPKHIETSCSINLVR